MSGPTRRDDRLLVEGAPASGERSAVELLPSRESTVGRIPVRRALPRRGRRTVGAWCFADHMGPVAVTASRGVDIGPHPHIGLQTVTWLVAGEILHRDSLGSEQVVRAGQLNLMTAGRGVAHSEEATGRYRGDLHGVQLWVAQPESTRHGEPAFEHHGVLPRFEIGGGEVTVIVGDLGEARSPARRDTDHLGVDLDLRDRSPVVLPVRPGHEHAVAVLDGAVTVDNEVVAPGVLCYLGTGRDELALRGPARLLLLGGTPFEEEVVMYWNYVARTREEILAAHHSWEGDDGRFGRVVSPLPRIPSPPPPWG